MPGVKVSSVPLVEPPYDTDELDPEDELEAQNYTALLEAIEALTAYEEPDRPDDLVLRATALLQRLAAGCVVPKGHTTIPPGHLGVDPQKVALIFTDGQGAMSMLDQQQPVGFGLQPRSRAIAAGLIELAWEGLVQPKRVIAGSNECGVICSFNATNRCSLPPHPQGTQHSGSQGSWF